MSEQPRHIPVDTSADSRPMNPCAPKWRTFSAARLTAFAVCVEHERISAEFSKGVLAISLPRAADARRDVRRINITPR